MAFLEPAAPRDPGADREGWADDWERDGDRTEGGGSALRPVEAEVVEGVGAETVRVLAEVLRCLLPAWSGAPSCGPSGWPVSR